MKHIGVAVLAIGLTGCVTSYPENPTSDELNKMHLDMDVCVNDVVPLEKRTDRQCLALEKALIAHYGSLDAFMDARKGRN